MPGGGKSSVGGLLAKRLGVSFADVDTAIEQRAGCTVAIWFERHGEAAFRDLESDVLADLVGNGVGVIATGGGSVLRPANRDLLRSRTTPVYLHATLIELWRRVRRNRRRPLLRVGDPEGRLREMLAERHLLYVAVAALTVETGEPSLAVVVETIVGGLVSLGVVHMPECAAEFTPYVGETP